MTSLLNLAFYPSLNSFRPAKNRFRLIKNHKQDHIISRLGRWCKVVAYLEKKTKTENEAYITMNACIDSFILFLLRTVYL